MGIRINSLRGRENGHTWPLHNFLTNVLPQTPLEVVLPSSSSGPLPGSHRRRVRPTSRPWGRAASLTLRTARPGECWALHDRPALAAPFPPAFPQPASMECCVRVRVQDGRLARPARRRWRGQRRHILKPRTRTVLQGPTPTGTSSARDHLYQGPAPSSPGRGATAVVRQRPAAQPPPDPCLLLLLPERHSCSFAHDKSAVMNTTERNTWRNILKSPSFTVVGCCVYLSCYVFKFIIIN